MTKIKPKEKKGPERFRDYGCCFLCKKPFKNAIIICYRSQRPIVIKLCFHRKCYDKFNS